MNSITTLYVCISQVNTFISILSNLLTVIETNTDNDIVEIRNVIKASDIGNKIRIIKQDLIKNQTNHDVFIEYAEIETTIKAISDEIGTIQYRIDYNNSLYIPIGYRLYKFNNCNKRLQMLIAVFESQYDKFRNNERFRTNKNKT